MNILQKYNINIGKVLKKLKNKDQTPFFGKKQIIESKGGDQYQIVCPFHNDRSPSMGINKQLNLYNCFVCNSRVGESKVIHANASIGKGPFQQFLKVFYEQVLNQNLTNKELAELCDIPQSHFNQFEKDLGSNNFSNSKNIKKEIKTNKLKFSKLDELNGNNEIYLKERLLSKKDICIQRYKETINHFLLRTLKDGSIIIPIVKNWNLIGIYVRVNTNQNKTAKGKYYNIDSFKKSGLLFNGDFTEEQKSVILVEGPLNAIRLWSLGYENVVSFFGAVPNGDQIKHLNNKEDIYVWFDDDEGGNNGVEYLNKFLPNTINLYQLKTNGKTDAYDYNKEEIKQLFKNFKGVKRLKI